MEAPRIWYAVRYSLRTLTLTPRLIAESGESERIRFSKQLTVIIYLALRPRAQATREELISLLWVGTPERDARSALRQVLYQIRQATDPDLVTGDEVLRLRRDEVEFDVDLFRVHHAQGRLEAALQLYDADFLSNVSLAGAGEFEAWTEGLRQQLAAERRQALRTLIARAADAGRWSEGARYAQLLIEADAGVLEPRVKLVEMLALSGDAIRASGAAADARAFAESVEGTRLSPEVEESIARALSPIVPAPWEAVEPLARLPEMVGRAAEFHLVVDKWRGALEGRGRAALLTGEAGIGKTRLTREVVGRLRRDRGLILRSACYAVEQSDPMAPFLELIRAAARASGLGGASPRCLSILGAFVPEIADRFRSAFEPSGLPVSPQVLGTALLDAFAAIAEEVPLLLVVEDLHWASPEAIEFAHRLARRAQSHHILLLLTARDYGDVPGATEALRALTATGAVKEIPLGPLDAPDIELLLSSIAELPDAPSARWLAVQLMQRTQGVPLYILEVLKSLHDSGYLSERAGRWVFGPGLTTGSAELPIPETAAAILEFRLRTIGDRPSAVLAAMAVWGRAASTDVLVRLTGLDAREVERAISALDRRRLIAREEGLAVVGHEALAAAALRGTPGALLVHLHERAARIARDAARGGRAGDWMAAARYAALAGHPDRAAVDVAQAAAAVERSSGHAAGQDTLSRALSTMPAEVRTHLQLALQRVLEGRWSARRWLAERSGWPRRLRYVAAIAGIALVIAAGLIIPRALQSRARAPSLGGADLTIGWGVPLHLDSVQALRIDNRFSARRPDPESIPAGEKEGLYPRFIRPDLKVAAVTCALPGVDPTAVCLKDLARGTTSTLASFDGDAQPLAWLPDGSALLVLRAYPSRRLGYTYGLILVDSTGRVVRTVTRDSSAFDGVWMAPTGERILVLRARPGRTEAELLSVGGALLGAVDWCNRSVYAAWSPDGRRLACALENLHQLQIGDGRPNSWPTRVTFPEPIQSGPVWSSDGRYVAVSVGGATPGVFVVDREGLMEPRRVAAYRAAPRLIGWTAPGAIAPMHKIRVDPDTLRLAVGDSGMLHATALGPEGQRLGEVPQVRWLVADSTVARVDDDGRVVADRPGRTVIVAAFGLESIDDTAYVSVAPSPAPLVAADGFDTTLDPVRWRFFGNSAPRMVLWPGRAGSAGFNANGRYLRSSGIALRSPLAVDRGLTIEYWASVPVTRLVSQSLTVALHSSIADSFHVGPGLAQPPSDVVAVGIEAPIPNQARRQTMAMLTDASPSFNLVPLPDALGDGGWHRYRLIVYPGGEVRWFADGREAIPPGRANLEGRRLWTLAFEGRSAGALVLVDDIKVWEGVVLDPVEPATRRTRRMGTGRVRE